MNSIRVLFLAAALAAGQPAPPDPIFRSGTRLVEVNVVVRDQQVRPPGVGAWFKWVFDSGPPFGPPGAPVKGLTKDDFTLLDQGRPQPIAVFIAGSSSAGQPPNDATVVLIDLLNTPWLLTDYARQGMKNLLRALTGTDGRIALYSLGKNLHILHDFTGDPRKLAEAAAELDRPHGKLPLEFATALRDYGDPPTEPPPAPGAHAQITVQAVTRIVQHLSSVPGRKKLVWLSQMSRLPPTVMALMQQANIVLYPVRVRSGGLAALGDESTTRDLGTAAGGRTFHDAMDLTFAVRAAEEDSHNDYVLGFYPAQDLLDGTYHKITVRINRKASEIYYRSGYLATKVAVPVPPLSLAALVEDPLESFRLGFTAEAAPEAQRPGLYDLRVTVDLHDIHLDHKEGHFTGAFDVSVPNPSDKGTTVMAAKFPINLTEGQFAEALRNGFTVIVSGAESELGEIHLVVRDHSTGIAGSLRVPVAKQ